MRSRRPLALTLVLVVLGALVSTGVPAGAVNAAQSQIVSANPADFTPFIEDGQVLAVVQVGNRLIAGGTFTQVKNWQGGQPIVTRNKILAFDATTGQLDTTFTPTVDGDVLSLAAAPDGTSVFVGGKFTTVNGTSAGGIVKLDVATGATVPEFTMSTNGWVQDMKVSASRLFLSGNVQHDEGDEPHRIWRGRRDDRKDRRERGPGVQRSDQQHPSGTEVRHHTGRFACAVVLGTLLEGRQPAEAVPGGARPDHHSCVRRPVEPAAHGRHVSGRELPTGGRHLT